MQKEDFEFILRDNYRIYKDIKNHISNTQAFSKLKVLNKLDEIIENLEELNEKYLLYANKILKIRPDSNEYRRERFYIESYITEIKSVRELIDQIWHLKET